MKKTDNIKYDYWKDIDIPVKACERFKDKDKTFIVLEDNKFRCKAYPDLTIQCQVIVSEDRL